jgi:hypothetical protein
MVRSLMLLPPDTRRHEPVLRDAGHVEAPEPAWWGYRSEAFAEDLAGFDVSTPARLSFRVNALLLSVLPCLTAVAAALLFVVVGR